MCVCQPQSPSLSLHPPFPPGRSDFLKGLLPNSTLESSLGNIVQLLSRVLLFATPWTVAHWVPWPMGFYRQEYWCRLPLPSPGNIPRPGIKPTSPVMAADSLPLSHLGSPHLAILTPFWFSFPASKCQTQTMETQCLPSSHLVGKIIRKCRQKQNYREIILWVTN